VNIETNYFSGAGSKPEEIVDSYINRRNELVKNDWSFIWITDGDVWRSSENQILKAFGNLDYVFNIEFYERVCSRRLFSRYLAKDETIVAKYPISHNGNKKLGEFFKEILNFHIPPSKQKVILDPTCGKKHLWEGYLGPNLSGEKGLKEYGKVIFSDVHDYGQELVSDVKSLNFDYQFDGIIYDPPYFFGYKGSDDPRRTDYGDYIQTLGDLIEGWTWQTASSLTY
jgi:hypothetical protein